MATKKLLASLGGARLYSRQASSRSFKSFVWSVDAVALLLRLAGPTRVDLELQCFLPASANKDLLSVLPMMVELM